MEILPRYMLKTIFQNGFDNTTIFAQTISFCVDFNIDYAMVRAIVPFAFDII